MNYAINIANFGDCSEAHVLADLAAEAEAAGWDAFFIWDHIAWDWGAMPMVDPTVALTAIALRTRRIRFGAMVTPLPRRRPWKLARETVALDRLSGGRLVVGVGLGIGEAEFGNLGEHPDLRTRASMLDEGLAVLTGLWRAEPFDFEGLHYRVKGAHFLPGPLQAPRIPIWVAGMWPNRAPFRRAARWDGVFPIMQSADLDNTPTPAELRQIVAFVRDHRESTAPFDVSIGATTPGDDPKAAAAVVAPYAEAGATWWQESVHVMRPDLAARAEGSSALDAMRWRIRQGPPRI